MQNMCYIQQQFPSRIHLQSTSVLTWCFIVRCESVLGLSVLNALLQWCIQAIKVLIYNCTKLKIGSSMEAGCPCCFLTQDTSWITFLHLLFMCLFLFWLVFVADPSPSKAFLIAGDLYSWKIFRVYRLGGWRNRFIVATLLTQNKKLKKKRKYRIHGLTKENVSARFRFSFLSIIYRGVYNSACEVNTSFTWKQPPRFLRHPANPQAPCEAVRMQWLTGLWGCQGGLKKGGHGCVTLPHHAGRTQNCLCRLTGQIAQKISLADYSWMAYRLLLVYLCVFCLFPLCQSP